MNIKKYQKNIFCEYIIRWWNDYRSLFENIKNWVLKGHPKSSWSLQTILERILFLIICKIP